MGNTMKVILKEDREALAVTEELVEEFQSYINMVDHSMEGLAKSVDSMRTACKMLLQQFDNKEPQSQDVTTSNNSASVEGTRLARNLLETIDNKVIKHTEDHQDTKMSSVSDYTVVVMESLSKFFHFVVNVSKSYTIPTEDSPTVFSVDKYRTQNTYADMEDGMSYIDARIGSLKTENKMLKEVYTRAKEEISNLNEREATYREEIIEKGRKVDLLKKKIVDITEKQNLEEKTLAHEKVTTLKSNSGQNKGFDEKDDTQVIHNLTYTNENEALKLEVEQSRKDMMAAKQITEKAFLLKCKEVENLEQEIKTLKQEKLHKTLSVESSIYDSEELFKTTENSETVQKEQINLLKREPNALKIYRVLPVIEYDTITSTYDRNKKEDLYQILQSEMASCNIELKITSWLPYKTFGIPHNKKVIVPMKISYEGEVKQKMHRVLKDLTEASNTVILLIYDADSQSMCKEVDQQVTEEFTEIGGVLTFGFSFNQKLFVNERNENNLKMFLKFLKGEGAVARYLSR